MPIPFTQFLRPDGRRKSVSIERSADIEAKAHKIIEAGYVFECENLQDGNVYLDCCNHDQELAASVVPNDESVLMAVDKVVTKAFERLGLS